MLGAKGNSRRSGKHVIPITFAPTAADVAFAVRLNHEGGLKPVIDRTYELEEIVEAHRYVDRGRKHGSVVLRVAGEMAGVPRRGPSRQPEPARPS